MSNIQSENLSLITEMANNPNVKGKELEQKFNISRRQLGYRIQKINDWLIEQDYPEIERTSQGFFIVDEKVKQWINVPTTIKSTNEDHFYTSEQRAYLILLILFREDELLSLNHFSIDLQVSKNTVLNDLKRTKQLLTSYNIELKYTRQDGYYLKGQEFELRNLLTALIDKVFQLNISKEMILKCLNLSENDLVTIDEQISKIEQYLENKFIDQSTATLRYKLFLIINRIQHNKVVHPFSIEYEALSDTEEYQATEILISEQHDIPRQEKLFITLQLLSTSVQWSDVNDAAYLPDLKNALQEMIAQFEKLTFITFEDKQGLINRLMLHMKPAFYRIKYSLSDIDSLQNNLKEDYKELFHLVKISSKPMEAILKQPIPDNEIAYLTILIGGTLRNQDEDIDSKVKAVVVCTQGTSISQLMLQELRNVFPEFIFLDALSLREFNHYALDFDIVFSPMHIDTDKKLHITKAMLTTREKQELRQHVLGQLNNSFETDVQIDRLLSTIRKHTEIHDESALIDDMKAQFNEMNTYSSINASSVSINNLINLEDLITHKHIQFMPHVDDVNEAIQLTASPLIEYGYVDPSYIKQMIESFDDTYMVINQSIAIPHAENKSNVHRTCMSMLILEEPIKLSTNHEVHIFVVIAATDKFKHLRPLLQLRDLAQDQTSIEQILNSSTKKAVTEIIHSFSNID
ncbi:BglG family transcription antiterminator [Staphylococcus gallinarum]|uniref:BglG family transcription antiterminator n=1 Tax=Staphylococcus gallinarum TaxID=1293 RepID=UPI001E44766C|nr:BglG family transcription antiterminator [Staphylococcus gallinarum]MEB6277942.1 BglG family transcription antiterminator [Staphylococcus gallinarum]UEH00089.1 BglG family transcription antiterminator [Staphylococcus gallinarum]